MPAEGAHAAVPSPEVARVRPGEELPWERLDAYLRPRLGVTEPMSVMQFPNGSANLTYRLHFGRLQFGEHMFVLRRPPFGLIARGAHDMKREFRVLSRLWAAYPRAPRAFVFCDDHSIVGSDFVVAEYRSGEVVWSDLPPSMAGLPDAGRRIGFATVDALADLHLVDPAKCELHDLGRPEGFMTRQLQGWRQRWDAVAAPEHDRLMTATAELLQATIPTAPATAIVHNDFKTDNCQFRPGEPDAVTAVFDWDMATVGDPLADLGLLLNYLPDPADTPDDRSLHVEGLELLGLPTRLEIVERYRARTGFSVSSIWWYEAFACWRTCVALQQLHQRYVRGETTDVRMAAKGENIGMLSRRAARIVREHS